jgi:integrase
MRRNLFQRRGIFWYRQVINGKEVRRSTKFRDRRAAERRAAEIELELRSGAAGWNTPRLPTVRAWWEVYSRTYTPLKRAPHRDHQLMAHALPFFGHMRLDEVKKSDCLQYLAMRRAAYTTNPGYKTQRLVREGTIQRERSFLQAVFTRAIEDGYDFKNPWRGIERKAFAVRDRVLTAREQAQLLAVLRPRYQRFVLVMVGTGLRLDEERHIDPGTDINWPARLIRVTGKFRKVRDVPIFEEVEPILKQQLAEEGRLWPQDPQRLREVLAEGAVKAGIPHLSPHTLRHTFGHRYLKAGGDVYVLSKMLGHSSVVVTERHYAHLLQEDLVSRTRGVRLGLTLPKTGTEGARGGTKVVTLARWGRQATKR